MLKKSTPRLSLLLPPTPLQPRLFIPLLIRYRRRLYGQPRRRPHRRRRGSFRPPSFAIPSPLLEHWRRWVPNIRVLLLLIDLLGPIPPHVSERLLVALLRPLGVASSHPLRLLLHFVRTSRKLIPHFLEHIRLRLLLPHRLPLKIVLWLTPRLSLEKLTFRI